MTIKWRKAKPGEICQVGMLMRWPGYPDGKSLGGPFVCFKKEGTNVYFRAWKPMEEDGLKIYQPGGYVLMEKMSSYSLDWAEQPKKPTIIIS